jgi:KilA-N domain
MKKLLDLYLKNVINFRYIMSDFVESSHFSNSSTAVNMSIVDVCYQAINDTYIYGSHSGFKVIINSKTGYVNATKLCGDHGKLYKNWTPLATTHQLMAAFNKNQHLTQDGWLTKTNNSENSVKSSSKSSSCDHSQMKSNVCCKKTDGWDPSCG